MAVTGAPSTTALQAARTAGAAAAGVGYQVPVASSGPGEAGAAPLHARTRTPTTPPVESSRGAPATGRPFTSTSSIRSSGGAVARVRVDLPLHGRDGGAQVRPVRREHRAEVLPGRVGVARAEALGPLERRRDEQRQVRPAIAAPDLGVNQRSVRIANVGSVGARQAGEGGQHPAVAREHGPDGHRHAVSLERDDPAEHVLVELLWGERGVGRLPASGAAGEPAGAADADASDASSYGPLASPALPPRSTPCGAVTPVGAWAAVAEARAWPLADPAAMATDPEGLAPAPAGRGGSHGEVDGPCAVAVDAKPTTPTRPRTRAPISERFTRVSIARKRMQAAIRLTRASAG